MRTLVASVLFSACAAAVIAAPTVTSPGAGTTSVGPADDFATRAFQDPWDMNQYTDVGWFTLGNDSPPSGLSDGAGGHVTVANGVMSATIVNSDPNFFLLDTRVPGNARLGKTGGNFPIDASKYRIFMISMCLNGTVPAQSVMQIFWSNNTIFSSEPNGGSRNTTAQISTFAGCHIYTVDMATAQSVVSATQAPIAWAGSVDSLRVDPTQFQITNPGTLSVDWARLLPLDTTLQKTITWTGSTNVDIYLDTNNNAADGGLVRIAKSVAGGSYTFFIGGVAPGDYCVRVCDAGSTSSCGYSPGIYRVLTPPRMRLTSPGDEGSADDFATTQLDNPWMTGADDFDFTRFVTGLAPTVINAVDEAGTSLGAVSVLAGTSTAMPVGQVGDPELYPLFHTVRGLNYRIDADRYRILTAELGLPGGRDLVAGSIARIIWKISDSPSDEVVSDDIDINHRAVPGGAIVLSKISADMREAKPLASCPGCHLAVESDPGGSPDPRGWLNGGGLKPGIDSFRLDPHEFTPATAFYIRRLKLAALEKAGSSFRFTWAFSDPSNVATSLTLIAATPVGPGVTPACSGITIASGLSPATGAFNWTNLSGFNHGEERHICAQLFSGTKLVDQVMSQYPILRDVTFTGTEPPRLVPERSRLNFGATNNGTLLSLTPAQSVALRQVGAGSVSWTATVNQPWLTLNGLGSTSGTGNGSLNVKVVGPGTSLPAVGLMYATITITSNAFNSPQYIDVYLNLIGIGGTQPPFGSFDTPVNGTTGAQGAIGITGWALDDIAISSVQLWRDRVNGDPAAAANGKIYIGDATLVSGARPDVAAAYPTMPQSYRAGWGYMLLTNLLPNVNTGAPAGGVGTFTLYAYVYDVEGRLTILPSHTFSCNNGSANKPFGTIDTPAQGAVVSGTLNNFGWVLTPQPGIVPTDGHTITLYIDNVPQGTARYNLARSDIASLFPGYANTNGPIGLFSINTMTLANGVHTIAWSVTDNLGRADGIGSRYFTVQN